MWQHVQRPISVTQIPAMPVVSVTEIIQSPVYPMAHLALQIISAVQIAVMPAENVEVIIQPA